MDFWGNRQRHAGRPQGSPLQYNGSTGSLGGRCVAKNYWIEWFWYFLVKAAISCTENACKVLCDFNSKVTSISIVDIKTKHSKYWRKTMKRIALILCIVFVSVAMGFISFKLGSFLGLAIWFCVFAFIAIEVIYYVGAKGPLPRSFRSNTSSEVPDARIEQSTQTARGRWDLDYRGRGRN